MTKKSYSPEMAYDGEYYVVGVHLTLEQAKDIMKEEYPKLTIKKINHVWIRHGILPEEVRMDMGDRGWWVVEEQGKGVGKATHIEV